MSAAVGWAYLLCFDVDDWMSERSLDVFQTDEVVSIVSSVLSSHHSALRLFLNRCAVTLEPNSAVMPSCDLLDYHGSEPHPLTNIYTNTKLHKVNNAGEAPHKEESTVVKEKTFVDLINTSLCVGLCVYRCPGDFLPGADSHVLRVKLDLLNSLSDEPRPGMSVRRS